MINTDLLDRLKEFIENEGKTCSFDSELITPLYVYRMWGRCYPDGRYWERVEGTMGTRSISGSWLRVNEKRLQENCVGRWLFIYRTTYAVWEVDFIILKSVRVIKRHCSIREYLLHLVSFNYCDVWVINCERHWNVSSCSRIPCMLNVLGFTFTHNSIILINNIPLYYVVFYTHILKS